MPIKSVPLSAEARLELASMAYSAWCASFDALKAAKAATWEQNKHVCPKSDWPVFYADQLKYAETLHAKNTRVKDEICPHSPIVADIY